MARGPSKRMSTQAVHDRLRRIKADRTRVIQAKAKALQGDTVGALRLLVEEELITEAHVQAHLDWLAEQLA